MDHAPSTSEFESAEWRLDMSARECASCLYKLGMARTSLGGRRAWCKVGDSSSGGCPPLKVLSGGVHWEVEGEFSGRDCDNTYLVKSRREFSVTRRTGSRSSSSSSECCDVDAAESLLRRFCVVLRLLITLCVSIVRQCNRLSTKSISAPLTPAQAGSTLTL